jgi:hypothetical protein
MPDTGFDIDAWGCLAFELVQSDLSMFMIANSISVRVCARPVSPVMMLPELFSVSTPLSSLCAKELISHVLGAS